MDRVSEFISEAIKAWPSKSIQPGSVDFSDGLACFRATAGAGSENVVEIMGSRKPKDVPIFQWLNTIIENAKTELSGTYHIINFSKFGKRYLAEVSYRFNCRICIKRLL
jgi:hypothetical protein